MVPRPLFFSYTVSRMKICPTLIVLTVGAVPSLFAHDPGLSSLEIELGPKTLVAAVTLAAKDFDSLDAELRGDPQLLARSALDVRQAGERIDGQAEPVTRGAANDVRLIVRFTLEGPSRGPLLVVHSRLLDALPRGHRQAVRARDTEGRVLLECLLRAGDPPLSLVGGAGEAAEPAAGFASFFLLGIEHILTGYDHLLFVLALLLAGGGLKEALKVITSFTVAHSVTLALAALDVVNITPRLIEPAIAASIAFVGLENLLRKSPPRRRWILTGFFGLVHGFGFAGALRESGLGADGASIALPLFQFNLGVEAGQLAVAALAYPLLRALHRSPVLAARTVPAASLAVTVAGVWWLVERTVGG